MNTVSKFASLVAVVALTSGAAIAGDTVVVQAGPYGQSGAVTYHQRARQNTNATTNAPTVAVYTDRHGIGQAAAAPDQQPQWNFHSQSFGSFGNGAPVSFYSQSR